MIGVGTAIFKFIPQQFQPAPTSQGKKTAPPVNVFCIQFDLTVYGYP